MPNTTTIARAQKLRDASEACRLAGDEATRFEGRARSTVSVAETAVYERAQLIGRERRWSR